MERGLHAIALAGAIQNLTMYGIECVEGTKMILDNREKASFAFGGEEAQKELLEKEGIVFESNGKIDLNKYGFRTEQ